MHTILIVLVAAVRIALDNGNGGDETRTYYIVYVLSKLKARQVKAIKSN